MTREEALRMVARQAMGDLAGYSEPPEDMPDRYPFNAIAWQKSLPAEWQDEAEEVLCYVYHNERLPDSLEVPQ